MQHPSTRKGLTRTACLLAAAAAAVNAASARASVSFTGTDLAENFDTLLNTGSNAAFSFVASTQAQIPDLTTWDGVKVAGSGGTNMSIFASTGTSGTGGMYSFGAAASTERALGAVASGTNTAGFGVEIVNNSGSSISGFTLSFTAEQWRSSTATLNTLLFGYGASGGAITSSNYLTSASMVSATLLNAPAKAPVASNGATDGNDSAFKTAVTGSVGITIPAGASLFLRWQDNDDVGADAGIGIDDFTFHAITGTKELTWNPPGTTWNTIDTNWLDGASASAFTNFDTVNFTDTGVGAVTVDAGGVQMGGMVVSNNSNTYTISGGSIGGYGSLTKARDGTLVLANTNTYTGGTVINGGTVSISGDQNLGDTIGGLTVSGGTLAATAAITSARPLLVTSSPGPVGAIDTGGFNVTFDAVGGDGNLHKLGAGSLIFTGNYNLTGNVSVAQGALVLAQAGGGVVNLKTGNSGGDLAGDLVAVNDIRLNLNQGNFGGGGRILTKATGTTISTVATVTNQSIVVGNDIVLNSDSIGGTFVTQIGCTDTNTLTIDGRISGTSDVRLAPSNAPNGGGSSGVLVLNDNNAWTGDTFMGMGSLGVARLGVNDALPIGTHLTFGLNNAAVNVGALDLNGHDQRIAGLKDATTGTINGIANTGAVTSTLTIVSDNGADETYDGPIGIPAQLANLPGANDAIAIVKSGPGTLRLTGSSTYTRGTTVNDGLLVAGHHNSFGSGELTVNGTATAQLNPGLTSAMKLLGLTITGGATTTAKLDITNNKLVVVAGNPTAVRDAASAGFNAGDWAGKGLTSSTLQGEGAGTIRGIGYARGDQMLNFDGTNATYGGQLVAADDLAIGYTYNGDTNMDGSVDIFNDFPNFLDGLNNLGTTWFAGDFNYDATVDIFNDFPMFLDGLNNQGAPLGPLASLIAAETTLSDAQKDAMLGMIAAVPEPTSIGLVGAGVIGMLSRRRRRI